MREVSADLARDKRKKTTYHLIDVNVLLRCCLCRRLLITSIRLLTSSSTEEAQQPLKETHCEQEEGDGELFDRTRADIQSFQ
jgi:hypothetical protein